MIFYILQARQEILDAATNLGCIAYNILSSQDKADTTTSSNSIYVEDPHDALEVTRAIEPLISQKPNQRHMCVGLGDQSSECAVLVNAALGLEKGTIPTFKSLETMRNKHRMRKTLGSRNPLNGKFWEVDFPGTTLTELQNFFAESPGEIVFKPIDGSGSCNVVVLKPDDNLTNVNIPPGRYLVEQRFLGPEFSVEGISWDGAYRPLVITAKTTGGDTGLVETAQQQPAHLKDNDKYKLYKAAEEVLYAAGYEYGLSHIEFILEEGQPRLIEAHGRVGGDRIADMMHWSVGKTAFEILLGTYCHQRLWPVPAEMKARGEAIIQFIDLRNWSDDDSSWLQQVNSIPGVIEAKILKPPKERGPIKQSSDRHAHVLAAGTNPKIAISAVERASNNHENPRTNS